MRWHNYFPISLAVGSRLGVRLRVPNACHIYVETFHGPLAAGQHAVLADDAPAPSHRLCYTSHTLIVARCRTVSSCRDCVFEVRKVEACRSVGQVFFQRYVRSGPMI